MAMTSQNVADAFSAVLARRMASAFRFAGTAEFSVASADKMFLRCDGMTRTTAQLPHAVNGLPTNYGGAPLMRDWPRRATLHQRDVCSKISTQRALGIGFFANAGVALFPLRDVHALYEQPQCE